MIKTARGVNDTVDFNPSGAHNVEYQVVFNDEDAIAQQGQLGMTRNASQMWVPAERPHPLVNRIRESDCA